MPNQRFFSLLNVIHALFSSHHPSLYHCHLLLAALLIGLMSPPNILYRAVT